MINIVHILAEKYITMVSKQKSDSQWLKVNFNKTQCGTDFYINVGTNLDLSHIISINNAYQTDCFEFFYFRKVSGYILLDRQKIDLKEGMLLILSPYQRQRWCIKDEESDFDFLFFREDFVHSFFVDKSFVYRLLYCYQTVTPPYLFLSEEKAAEIMLLLRKIRKELHCPIADSYHMILSILCHFLLVINREYANYYHLPFNVPKNNYAYRFKELLEQHIYEKQRINDYAEMLQISRVSLNNAVMSQFGVSAIHLLKQRLLAAIKNELLFSNATIAQLADKFNYSEVSHLMRFFKQHTGKTITQYKRDYQNGIYE